MKSTSLKTNVSRKPLSENIDVTSKAIVKYRKRPSVIATVSEFSKE